MTERSAHVLLEPDDLLRMPDGDRYELIDGVPVEKMMGAKADRIGTILIGFLVPYCRANKLGLVYGAATGYQCFPNRPRQVRLPDVSFVATGRLPNDETPDGYITIAPDLAVEVVSPKDRYERVMLKLDDYRSARVRLVWVISPKTKSALIRRLDGSCAEVFEGGELGGEDVIPGFTCKMADLFA
jgi:Uma2 family endonuclease